MTHVTCVDCVDIRLFDPRLWEDTYDSTMAEAAPHPRSTRPSSKDRAAGPSPEEQILKADQTHTVSLHGGWRP